jgi:hypothetical protein
MLVTPLAPPLFMMVHNDWANGTEWGIERKNVALWFNRGGGINFVQGPGFAVGEHYSVYPQTFVDLSLSQASICYTSGSSIRLAMLHPLPDPQRRYVYPRTNLPGLYSGAPLEANGLLTFSDMGGWMHSHRPADLRGNFSIAMWVKPETDCAPDGDCMLLDTRGADGHGALLGLLPSTAAVTNCSNVPLPGRVDCGFYNITAAECEARGCCFEEPYISGAQCYFKRGHGATSSRQPYFYPAYTAPGLNLASPLNITGGEWNFVGLTVTLVDPAVRAQQQSGGSANALVQFFVNGRASDALPLYAAPGGQFNGSVAKLARFTGAIRMAATFPGQVLTLVEQNAFANQFADSLLLPHFSPSAPNSPSPELLLDPSNASTTLANWQSSAPAGADAVSPAGGGKELLLCGEASAGVDIDYISGVPGERFEMSFRFRLASRPNGSLQRGPTDDHTTGGRHWA